MRIVTTALALGLLPTLATAQLPAPTAEARPAEWSPAEAQALTWLQQRRIELLGRASELPRDGVAMRQFRIRFFTADREGHVEPATRIAPGSPWVALAWPTTADATAQRGLLLHDDGTTLVCELEPGATPEPLPDLAIAKGSNGRFADLLKQPGTGAQGHLWLWLDQVAANGSLTVVDERGTPIAGVTLTVMPTATNHPRGIDLPTPLPAGMARTGDDGIARLRGPNCGPTVVVLEVGDDLVRRDGVQVAAGDRGQRLTVPKSALVNKSVLANESAAIATLRNIRSAQMQCQASSAIDVDRDGKGEFGGFLELSGNAVLRGTEASKMSPPVLSTAFGRRQDDVVQRSGYCFQLWLPGKDGVPVLADAADANARIDAELAEQQFLVLAWPMVHGRSGLAAFAVASDGTVHRCVDPAATWSGKDRPLPPLAPFAAGSTALGATFDTTRWRPVP